MGGCAVLRYTSARDAIRSDAGKGRVMRGEGDAERERRFGGGVDVDVAVGLAVEVALDA